MESGKKRKEPEPLSGSSSDVDSQSEDEIDLAYDEERNLALLNEEHVDEDEEDDATADKEQEEEEEQNLDDKSKQKSTKELKVNVNDAGDKEELEQEFDFVEPNEKFFHGIKDRLKNFLDGNPYHASSLTDLVIKQFGAGNIITIGNDASNEDDEEGDGNGDDENEVYGFSTVISMDLYGQEQCMKEIKDFSLAKAKKFCKESQQLEKFREMLKSEKIGLFVNERLINLPPAIVFPLHKTLYDDIEWQIEEAAKLNEENEFDYDYVLVITASSEELKKKPDGGKKQRTEGKSAKERIYHKFEDELIREQSTVFFEFESDLSKPNKEKGTGNPNENFKVYRMISIVPVKKFYNILANLEKLTKKMFS
mmetsp:Transcript_5911/g.6593  ORF Transcript_5911/g.6593 Transcript_5911/m.6593 type:complete len:366 (-) Transcript_5911:333-1430(-)